MVVKKLTGPVPIYILLERYSLNQQCQLVNLGLSYIPISQFPKQLKMFVYFHAVHPTDLKKLCVAYRALFFTCLEHGELSENRIRSAYTLSFLSFSSSFPVERISRICNKQLTKQVQGGKDKYYGQICFKCCVERTHNYL